MDSPSSVTGASLTGALDTLRTPLPTALAVLPGPRAAVADAAGARDLSPSAARSLAQNEPVLVAHAALTARRLGLGAPARSPEIFDVLELYAFARPARFCAPSAAGLARELSLPEPRTSAQQAQTLRDAAFALLDELAAQPTPSREEALATAETLARARWAWGPSAVAALRSRLPPEARPFRGMGLDVWARLPEWEDEAPTGEPGTSPLTAAASEQRLAMLLARQGLSEARPSQREYSAETTHAFQPRDAVDEPRFMIAEAGTGVGKTLGYLAPASLWAEQNKGAVWVSTYTRALQRQIERESAAIFPDPDIRARKAVVRKGRENYACLLNFQEVAQAAQLGNGDLIGAALTARWLRATRDGDMTGGDFPAWLPGLFAVGATAQAGPAALVDRRGECLHAGCSHYRTCFVEKAIRKSRRADIVIANHALVMTQAAYDGGHAARRAEKPNGRPDAEAAVLKRLIFDEGHHLFEAADSAFSACLSGQEAAELRRWIRGPEGRRRGRGLELRLGELVSDNDTARDALTEAVRAASVLPGEGWSARIAPLADADAFGEPPTPRPHGPVEAFLAALLDQIRARSSRLGGASVDMGEECPARPTIDAVREAAPAAAQALAAIEDPLLVLAKALEDLLDQESDVLESSSRARIEGALRGLDRRACVQLPAWRAMLADLIANDEDAAGFVDWFEAVHAASQGGRLADAAFRRHYIDPTEPLHQAVIRPAHGVLVTSATLTDPGHDSPFALAEMRTGAARLSASPKLLRLTSPFDYAANARAIVVTDVGKDDPRQVAAAMRELFLASGGGALGLFTAIRRLRAVYDRIAAPLGEAGLPLYAQHVDPLEVGALVDTFRTEEDACLLGTDAIRDGVDVPGRSLRLLVFDRLPWPRPDLLHKARREKFGGRLYDDAIARGRLAQAFGRLIRRADDKGVFVLLDAAAPTRLFSALPEGMVLQRLGLVEAIEQVKDFLG